MLIYPVGKYLLISIHALREEGDFQFFHSIRFGVKFLSTPSARRATANLGEQAILKKISIHALREEGDVVDSVYVSVHNHFYPRPPRGGRHLVFASLTTLVGFLSTPSARRATSCKLLVVLLYLFLSTPSARRATVFAHKSLPVFPKFLSTPSARRATNCARRLCRPVRYFYPRPPRGGRLFDG